MNELSPADREELRHVVLEILANRHPVAIAPHVVARHAKTALGGNFSAETIASTLQVLRGLGLAASELDPLGSTQYWSATAAGVLAMERKK